MMNKIVQEHQVRFAEKLAKDNGGLIPSTTELRNLSYFGLVQSLKRYPMMFKHLKQKRYRRLRDFAQII